jgi:Tfp pilus assembly protein PilF
VLAVNARYAPAYVELGRVAMKRAYRSHGDYAIDGLLTARSLADKALAISPNLASALILRGWIYDAQKDTRRAAEMAAAAEAADKSSIPMQLLAGDVAFKAKDYEATEQRARYVIENARERQHVYSGYALLEDVYRAKSDAAARDQVFQREIEVDPDSAWTKGNYAAFLAARGECDRAIELARAALAQMEYGMGRVTLADAYVCKGNAQLWDQGKPDDARASFARALTTHQDTAGAWYGLGAWHALEAVRTKTTAPLAEARTAYEKALAIDPKHALAREELAVLPK